jgi:hypothetical protein
MNKITVKQIQKIIEEIQPQKLTEIFSQSEGATTIVFWAGGVFPDRYVADWRNTKPRQRFCYKESNLIRAVHQYNLMVEMHNEDTEKEELSGSCNDAQPGSNFLVGLLLSQ